MKTCKCGAEVREDQEICIECYKKLKNLREIARDELVLDCDDREHGDVILRQVGMLFSADGYRLEVWRAEGGKSYHVHIKSIPYIAELPKEQNKLYKELLIKKYQDRVKEILGYEPEGLSKVDYSLCVPDHLVAEENKPHFKYKTEKKFVAVVNEGYENKCDKEVYNLATQQKTEYNPTIKGSGITAQITRRISIVDIAKQFGLSVNKNKTLCPFHPDNNTPSLVFYEQEGRFYCFGCLVKGNIIKFYAMLKELNPNFRYKKPQEQPQ